MTPVLLFPAGLAALAALVIPLILHLRRRTEETPIAFAALRWLDPRPRPRRKLRFDEWLLLIVRLLLIAMVALLIARPAAYGLEDARARVLVAPGVDARRVLARAEAENEVRWIAPGFPTADTPVPTHGASLASLIRQYDAELPHGTPLTIVVPEIIAGADGDRMRLTRPVRWTVVAGATPPERGVAAATPFLDVRHPAGAPGGLRYFRAAAGAWAASGTAPRFASGSGDAPPSRERTLVWLKPGVLPDAIGRWIDGGGTALLAAETRVAMPGATQPIWRDALGVPLVEGASSGRGRILRLTRPLTPSAMPQLLDPDFPDRLRAALAEPSPAPDRVAASAYAPEGGVTPYPIPPRDLAPWLAIAIAAAFLLERWLANARRRNVAR